MAILASEALPREKNPVAKMLPPMGIEPRQPLILSLTLFFLHYLDICLEDWDFRFLIYVVVFMGDMPAAPTIFSKSQHAVAIVAA